MFSFFYQTCLTTTPGGEDLLRAAIAQIENLPYVYRARMFWRDFDQMRGWWAILIPLFLWLGWRTYRRERGTLRAQRAARLAQSQADTPPEQDQLAA